MLNRRIVAAAVLAVVSIVTGLSAWVRVASLNPEALAALCAEARPQWQRYDEDIKSLGAGPVAAWRGAVVWVQAGATGIEVAFALEAPWDGYEAALPILVRVPDGTVLYAESSKREAKARIYTFVWKAQPEAVSLPWIEARYPHAERRFVLDAAGRWEPAAG
ncbi:MAG: hypothetical protein HYV27_02070 [Candidatus Hydrogenedentes bacterium]|nr:hypothetical protein [Candidatus Hydrogenedentota bacterium]